MTGDDIAPHGRDEGDEFLDDPSLRVVIDRVGVVLRAAEMRPEFRDRLRAELVAARAAAIADTSQTASVEEASPESDPQEAARPQPVRAGNVTPFERPVRSRRTKPARTGRRPVRAIGLVAAAAAVIVGAGGVAVKIGLPVPGITGQLGNIAAVSDITGNISADPTASFKVKFSQPVDHVATEAALRLSPATAVRTSWQGDDLTVSPVHGLAANAAYVLTIDRTVARTASGHALANDLHIVFGTAPVIGVGPAPGAPVDLPRNVVAPAAEGSEAVVTLDGSLLLTSAKAAAATGQHAGLVRVDGTKSTKISAATDAICVSRSGHSIAYLAANGNAGQVVFADRSGARQGSVQVTPDHGSPLGWIEDNEVTFVSGGFLRAVDRSGRVRVLSQTPVDVAHGVIAVSPGGRYVYVKSPADAAGHLIDVVTGASHPLDGISGAPSFSGDGATVVWLVRRGNKPEVAVAASGGGPVLVAPLPVQASDRVSDLAVSPDASRFVYSVTTAGGKGELRLASLPDGDTLAVSSRGAGESPNWAHSGNLFTVLAHGTAGMRIESIPVPARAETINPFASSVAAFTNAQLSGDLAAQKVLASSTATLPHLPQVTRVAVLWILSPLDGTATARVRFTVDPQPANPVGQQAEETLTLLAQARGKPAVIKDVSIDKFTPIPAGPQVLQIDTDATPGSVVVTFDSDLEPATVQSAVALSSREGVAIHSTVTYDAAARTVTLRPAAGRDRKVLVTVGTGARDVSGQHVAAEVRVKAIIER